MTNSNDQSQVPAGNSNSQPQHVAPPPAAPSAAPPALPAAQPSQSPPRPTPSAPLVTPPRSLAEHLASLPPQQAAALRGIMDGQDYVDIANTIGVNPRTIGYWRTTDPEFIAAVHAWRAELIDSTRNCLREMALAVAAANPEAVARWRREKSDSQPRKPRRPRRRPDPGAK